MSVHTRIVREQTNPVFVLGTPGTAVNSGDFVCLSSNAAVPADVLYSTNVATTYPLVHNAFIGVSLDYYNQSAASANVYGTSNLPIATTGIVECNCVANATPSVIGTPYGVYVTSTSSGSQTVAVVAAANAVGISVAPVAANATRVQLRIVSTVVSTKLS